MNRNGWVYKKLGEVCSFYRGLTYSGKDEVAFSTNVVLRSNNINLDTNTVNFDELKYISEDIKIPNDKKLKANSIFMCMSNGSKQHLGKVAFIDKNYDYAFGGFMGLIIPSSSTTIPKFIYHYFCSNRFKNFIKTIGNGANINNIKFSDIGNSGIYLPSKEIQLNIVSELDSINEAISMLQQELKDLDALAQSIFYDMFGDPVQNPKGWEVSTLKEVSKDKLSYGSGASAVKFDGNVRYIRITDIDDGGNLNEDIVSPSIFEDKYILNEGDILFARSGATVGKTYCHKAKNGKCIYAGYLIKFVPNHDIVLPSYVFGYTKTPYYKAFIANAQRAVAQPNINAKQYGDLKICVPPLAEQKAFESQIESIESSKDSINAQITEMQNLLSSRMQYWFD